jgi:hypothetical protein
LAKTHIKTEIPYYTSGCGRALVVPVLERAFVVRSVVGGEVVAATMALAGRGRELEQISVAIDQLTNGPSRDALLDRGNGIAAV